MKKYIDPFVYTLSEPSVMTNLQSVIYWNAKTGNVYKTVFQITKWPPQLGGK